MEIYELGHLFEAVQMNNILSDGKTFPDCLPKMPLEIIQKAYENAKNTEGCLGTLERLIDKHC